MLEEAQGNTKSFEFYFLERETGFEPAASTLGRLHSTVELFPQQMAFEHTVFVLQICSWPWDVNPDKLGMMFLLE